ncbi:glycosyltransferase family 4 protein [Streptomyces sp. NPDC088719]|uniref:glycosyltransferase family 4 protein n=1 Tax=Streptomyces sp. NPDC088719 TaxID=3365872 RepID=UPI00382B94E7
MRYHPVKTYRIPARHRNPPGRARDLGILRGHYRRDSVLDAGELLDWVGLSPRTDVLADVLLPRTRQRQGDHALTAGLLGRLEEDTPDQVAASLLDLATEHRTLPVTADDIPRRYEVSPRPRLRHAAWRLLSTRCDGTRVGDRLLRSLDTVDSWSFEDSLAWAAAARRAGIPERDIGAALPSAHTLARTPPRAVPPGPGDGLGIVQTSLRGPLFQPGQGDSGGLSVFLGALGTALPGHPAVDRVITVTLSGTDELREREEWFTELTPGHLVLTLPSFGHAAWNRSGAPGTGVPAHPELSWWLEHLVTASRFPADIVHVRFSEDTTWAAARAAPKLGARLVFTVTPDPHRSYPAGNRAERADLVADAGYQDDMHRILLADVLVDRADAVLGLPGSPGRGDLSRHFPQLRPGRPGAKPVRVVGEGVAPLTVLSGDDRTRRELVDGLFRPHGSLPRLGHRTRGSTVLLNVGRLHPVKQQHLLLESWLHSELSRRTALVIVGGSTDRPTRTELDMLDRLHGLLRRAPWADGRVALLPSLPNRHIRLLESGVVELLPAAVPHVYACSSVKEEFGIAVLEAMDAGLLVVGPRQGGLRHYIEHGRNGFLTDTSSSRSLREGLEDVFALGEGGRGERRLRSIAWAGRVTVREELGMDRVRDAFAEVYRRIAQTPARERSSDGRP